MGTDPLYGVTRLTFGAGILESGIDFIVVMIGLFAIGEVLEVLASKESYDFTVRSKAVMKVLKLREIWALRAPIVRGTGIGCLIGVIPGGSAVMGALVAYGIERQVNPRRDEFGTGVAAGLAAPEASKNATTGTALIPLLSLGIPSTAAAAIMLAALVGHGVQPGPMLYQKSPEMLYAIFASFTLANVFMILVSVLVARGFGALMRTDPAIICAFIIVFGLVGAFGVRNNIADVYICIAFGIVGFYMRRFGFPTAPLVLGVILGPLGEGYFMTSMANYGDDWTVFFTRPKSGFLLAVAAGFVVWALWPEMRGLVRSLRDGRRS